MRSHEINIKKIRKTSCFYGLMYPICQASRLLISENQFPKVCSLWMSTTVTKASVSAFVAYQSCKGWLSTLTSTDFSALALIFHSSLWFSSEMKSKQNSLLVFLSLFYAVLKILHFSVHIYSILWVILSEYCEGLCVAEYFELFFIAGTFIPLALLIYGVVKVKLKP